MKRTDGKKKEVTSHIVKKSCTLIEWVGACGGRWESRSMSIGGLWVVGGGWEWEGKEKEDEKEARVQHWVP